MSGIPLRRIDLLNGDNFRDIGGYGASYGVTSFGAIYRSADISKLQEGDLPSLFALNIQTIIDLRSDDVREEHPDPLSLLNIREYHALPVNGGGRIAVDENDMMDSYFEMIDEPVSAARIFRALINGEKPLLIHCTAGKDRTGVFVALLLLANGVDQVDVSADYYLSLPLLKRTRDETLKSYPDFPRAVLYPSPDFFPKFLELFFAKYRSMDNYFNFIGLNKVERESLANLLGTQERSYGAILFKDGKALIEKMGLGHVSLPKGHMEAIDEDLWATIHRELKEELSIDRSSYRFLDDERYPIVYSPREGHIKRVEFAVAEVNGDIDLTCDQEEVVEARFLPYEEALKALTFQSDKNALSWAFRKIKGRGS